MTHALLVCLFLVPPTFSQQPSSSVAPVVRDSPSLAVIQKAIQALVGTESYSQTNGVIARGTLEAAPGGISGAILWEWAGSEFHYERPGPNGTVVVFASGHGSPALSEDGKTQRSLDHLAMVTFPVHLPSVALAAIFSNPNVSFGTPQQATVNGTSFWSECAAVVCRNGIGSTLMFERLSELTDS
jgi:hypothetical protein